MSSVAIIGGGISGLSAAYYLSKLPKSTINKIIVLEASNHLGGWVSTTRFDDGTIFEHGPRSVRGAGRSGLNTLELIEDLDLSQEVIPVTRSHPASKNRFIYVGGKLHVLPNSLSSMLVKQSPFTKSLLGQVWREPFTSKSDLPDETIHSFVKRRLGSELAELAIDPMCRGIYAGDCRKLSVKSCFGELHRLEQEYGSLIKGMLRTPKTKMETNSKLYQRFKDENWAIWSLKKGLQQIPETMVARMKEHRSDDVQVYTETPCKSIEFREGKVKVTARNQLHYVDHVISSIWSKDLSHLLPSSHSALAAQLADIPAVTVAVVNLEYPGNVLDIQGFGHLIPSTEGSKIMGVIYESCVFPQHDCQGEPTSRLTCMMGGAWFNDLFGDADKVDLNKLSQIAIDGVRDQLNVKVEPVKVKTVLQKDCIPQYLVGHAERLENIQNHIKTHRLPLSLIGSSYKGVSVNDCIWNARLETENILKQLQNS